MVEAMLQAEAVAQRRRQQARARRRADQRERRQLERHDARAGAHADGDRQLAVLHRGIERLLQRALQAVDLVDEEDAAGLQRGQERGDVGLALERRAGGHDERRVELGGDDLRERRLAEAGRSGEQDVVEHLAARERGLDRDRELLLERRLADEVLEAARAQRAVELELLLDALRGLDARGAHRARAARSAFAMSALRRVLGRVAQQLVGLDDREAELDEAVAGEAARVVGAGDDDLRAAGAAPATFSRSSTMIRSAVRLPMPGMACRRATSPDASAATSSRGVPPRQHRQRDLRADRLHADQQQEQVALLLGGEAVEHAARRRGRRGGCAA